MGSETWHALSEPEIFKILGAREEGLTKEEAAARLKQYGYNEIVQFKKTTALTIFLSQFKSFLILVLIAAIIISFALGEILDGIVILAVVIVNTLLGFFQGYFLISQNPTNTVVAIPNTYAIAKDPIG